MTLNDMTTKMQSLLESMPYNRNEITCNCRNVRITCDDHKSAKQWHATLKQFCPSAVLIHPYIDQPQYVVAGQI